MREFADYYFKPSYIAIVVLSLLSLAAIGTAGYLYWNSRQAPSSPILPIPTDNTSLLKKIGLIIELPAGEEPTVATITDKTKLADQAFFAPAENGDMVLIYANAKKAYLYRPSANKIIDVSPVNFPAPTETPPVTDTATVTPIVP